MFTVNSPNFVLDALGNITIGGVMVADTEMYLCYNYASRPGALYSGKVSVLKLDGGTFTTYYVSSGGIFSETSTAVGLNTPVLKLGIDQAIQAIITDKQLQAQSIYAPYGIFEDMALSYANGNYGGRVYKCCSSTADNGIASPGWVKKYVDAVMPSTPDLSGYMKRSVNIISGTESVSYCLRNAYVSSNGGIEFTLQQINTSDARLKDIIARLNDVSALYMSLVPETFSFKPGMDGYDSSVIHFGVDAQATIKAMEAAGLNSENYCLVFKEDPMDIFGDTKYVNDHVLKVDYNEFHGLHIAMIQKQQKEIQKLQMENMELRGKIDILEQRMEELTYVINNKINQS